MQQRAVFMLCPICEIQFEPKVTNTNICPNCLISQMNILDDIQNDKEVLHCRNCKRYQRPPWVLCDRDSKELLSICLKKVTGQLVQILKIITQNISGCQIYFHRAEFKEVMNGTSIQQSKTLDFEETYTQCEDCKREFTPHVWGACIQLRQRVDHKKSFLHLEQLILQHHMNEQLLKVESADDGMNFYFKQKNQALHMLEFIRQHLPIKIRESKEVYSFIKYTYVVDVPRICRDDLAILPHKLCSQLGGINRIQLCYRVASQIYLIDPVKLKICELPAEKYFAFDLDIRILPFRENVCEFTILDVEKLQPQKNDCSNINNPFTNSLCEVELMRDDDPEYQQHRVKSHLGNVLQSGMTVQGFDLNKYNNELSDIPVKPEFIIVKKKQEKNKKKKVQLKRLEIEETKEKKTKKKEEQEQQQLEEFMEELEQDQEQEQKQEQVKQ